MTEYLIQEEQVVGLADVIREKYADYNLSLELISDKASIETFIVPNGLTTLGNVFSGCNIKKVYASDVESWLNLVFLEEGANPLNAYTLSSNSLPPLLYFDGNLVENVVVPNTITNIGNYAFDNCRSLASITIPDGVTSIGTLAFFFTSLTSITIPDSVTSIGVRAFSDCENLRNIVVGSGITYIPTLAFYSNSDELVNIYFRSATPPKLTNTSALPQTVAIHVPVGSGDAYKSATNWSSLADYIVEDVTVE